jgi:hypothetical protein
MGHRAVAPAVVLVAATAGVLAAAGVIVVAIPLTWVGLRIRASGCWRTGHPVVAILSAGVHYVRSASVSRLATGRPIRVPVGHPDYAGAVSIQRCK